MLVPSTEGVGVGDAMIKANFPFLFRRSGKGDVGERSPQKKRTRPGSPPESGHVRLLAAGLHIVSA